MTRKVTGEFICHTLPDGKQEVYWSANVEESSFYKTYIQSEGWKAVTKFLKRSMDYRCQVCGQKGSEYTLHIHHNNYNNLGQESIKDLIVLCEECHQKFHNINIGEMPF